MTKTSSRLWTALDSALVLVLTGTAAYQLLSHSPSEPGWGPRWSVALFLAAALLPLAWRRRHPLAVAVVIPLVAGAQSLAVGDWPSFQVFVAVVVALYSVAAHSDRGRALAGAAVTAFVVVLSQAAQLRDGEPYTDLPGPWILLGAVWFGGRALRRRRLQAELLAEYALALDRRREEDARLAVSNERARIARELHDIVAHAISVMVVQAQAAQRVLEGEESSARESLSAIEDTGRGALVEMRRLLGVLREDEGELTLAPQPTLDHIEDLVANVREAGLAVDLSIEGERRLLPPGVDLSAFRIVQEALTNALKHAGPARAHVTVRYRPNGVELEVVDDGCGTNTVATPDGHGLVGMRERAAIVGGAVETESSSGSGYAVRALLPT